MTATLDEIHRDPEIIDRAIEQRELLEIISAGQVAATLTPAVDRVVVRRRRFDVAAHRSWLERTWGKRTFTDDEVQEMGTAQDRLIGE